MFREIAMNLLYISIVLVVIAYIAKLCTGKESGILCCAVMLTTTGCFIFMCLSFAPVTQKEYDQFLQVKSYAQSGVNTDDPYIAETIVQWNQWLEDGQRKVTFAANMYADLPEGFLEETPIEP